MTISIVIPVFNVEKYLEQCLNSVIRQSYRDLDIILVDDGSTDNSPEICEDFAGKDSRIKVIHKTNQGLSEARNTGLSTATGEYVLFIDSDDYLVDEQAVSSIVNVADNYHSVEMILFGYVTFYEKNKRYRNDDTHLDLEKINGQKITDCLNYLIRSGKFTISACTRMMKRSFLLENGINFEKDLLTEDLDWIFKVWNKVQHVNAINRDLYVYRKREGSITSSFGVKNTYDILGIIKKWSSYYLQPEIDPQVANLFLGHCAYQLSILMGYFRQLPGDERKILYHHLKKQRWLFQYDINHKTHMVVLLLRFTGFRLTCFILSLYLSAKGK